MRIPKVDILFVLSQFILFLLYVLEPQALKIFFPEAIFWFGLVCAIFGAFISVVAVLRLNVHLSPFPSPLPGARLIQEGVFRYVRHPIYSGIFLSFFGFSIIYDSGYKMAIAFILLVLFYFKSRYEEKRLTLMFPEYPKYARRTGRFWPKIGKITSD